MVDPELREELHALVRARAWDAADAIAAKIVSRATTTDELVGILEDDDLIRCWGHASETLAARGACEARIVLRRLRGSWKARRRAVAQLSASEVHDLFVSLRPAMNHHQAHDFWFAVVDTPGAARDARWLDLADPADVTGLNGVAMLLAIARDSGNRARDAAVTKLANAMEAATDPVTRGGYVYALGETGSPLAVPALLRELPRVKYGSLVIGALARCAGLDEIPILEKHGTMGASAVITIRARVARDAIIAADPVLAELTRAAAAGDLDAARVLEDALRERDLDQVP